MSERPADIAVIVPVLARPQNVQPLVNSLTGSCDARQVRIVFVATATDTDEIRAIQRAGFEPLFRHEPAARGDYAAKMNIGFRWSLEPLLLLGADDLRFHEGWAEAVIRYAQENPTVGVIGTDDLGNPMVKRGQHSTHPVVRRSYIADPGGSYDEPGVVYHEGYHHQSVDVELVELAKHRGAWGFCAAAKVEHLHPFWRKSEQDPTYAKSLDSRNAREDQRLFEARRKQWRRRAA